MGWKLDEVERPFVEQLVAIGWCYVEVDLDEPVRTGRASFTEVMQKATLRRQLHAAKPEPLACRSAGYSVSRDKVQDLRLAGKRQHINTGSFQAVDNFVIGFAPRAIVGGAANGK
jgi:hypothetical protein